MSMFFPAVSCSDLALFVSVVQAQRVHGAHNGRQRLDGVAVNDGLVLLYVVTREAVLVDDPARTERLSQTGNGSTDVGGTRNKNNGNILDSNNALHLQATFKHT